jgi:hypothetical protein
MITAVEASSPAKNPATRQVLANVGNRYVVFGSRSLLPGSRVLGPDDVHQQFSERVGDEYDFPPERLVQSILVDGAEVRPTLGLDRNWDIEIAYTDGSKSLVEIKIRERDFAPREFSRHVDWLREMRASGSELSEVWSFNIERLRLNIMTIDADDMPNVLELEPLDVWEFNRDGGTFDRSYVVKRVADWVNRINSVYTKAQEWSEKFDISIDKSRTVLMSEEIMQKFAVPDLDLPILDLSKNDKPLLSFVPFGLWIFGSNGRIDVISKQGTALLVDTARSFDPPDWQFLPNRNKKSFLPWSRDAFLTLLEASEVS